MKWFWRHRHESIYFTRTMKIGFLYDGRPLQGLSSGTAGQGSFFKFLLINPPRGRPFGGRVRRQSSYLMESGVKISASLMNATIFKEKSALVKCFHKKT